MNDTTIEQQTGSAGGESIKTTPLPKLKPNTKAFLNLLNKDKKISQTQAYIQTHRTTSPASARASASKLLATPNVILYTSKMLLQSRDNIHALANGARSEKVKLDANLAIQNRELGTPVQQIKQQSIGIQFTIDLSGDGDKITETTEE